MNLCVIVPIILDTYTSCELLAAFTGLMLIFEGTIVTCSKTVISISVFNLFLYVQMACGILRKASLLGLAVFIGMGIRSKSLFGIIVGSIGILSILVEQVLTLRTLRKESKVDQDAVLPNIEST
jgi:hypothetical protein